MTKQSKNYNYQSDSSLVSGHYRNSEFEAYAERIYFCTFTLDNSTGSTDPAVDLSAAKFCRVRYCPVCQWRRSLMWKAKAYQVLPIIVEAYPNYRWLFLTLTVKNCAIADLKETLTWMHESFKRMTKLKSFPAVGWLKSTEVTREKDRSAHPHFHCLLLVKPSYFGKNYIKQSEWVDTWRRCLKIDYNPVLDVQAIERQGDAKELTSMLSSYWVREAELTDDREWFLELTRQTHKLRFVSSGGVLKDYLSQPRFPALA
jgi:plasmid rolling circle replication initiator protein Rep